VDPLSEYDGCVIQEPEALCDYINERGDGPFRIAYRDRGLDGREMSVKFQMLQSMRNAWLCVEEAGMWVGPTQPDPEVTWFVNYGRHNALSSIWVARRPTEIHRNVTANADVILSFQQHEPRDLAYIREIGGNEAAERIEALGPHEFDYVLAENDEVVQLLEEMSDDAGGSDATSRDVDGARGADSARLPGEERAGESDGSASGGAGATGSGPGGDDGANGSDGGEGPEPPGAPGRAGKVLERPGVKPRASLPHRGRRRAPAPARKG